MPNTTSSGLLTLLAFAATLAATPALVHAAPSAAAADDTVLTSERARLRDELARVNAEIDTLKRSPRGVGDDYRLHGRQADAEALARRLIDIEARLGLRSPSAKPGPLPVAAPTDGPSDLEAKADILADQSRRVRLEADALDRRVGEAKGRRDLRRRAADLDRDPFEPFEGAKRRMASIAATDSSGHGTGTPSAPTSSTTSTPVDRPATNPGLTVTGTAQTVGGAAPSTPPTPLTGAPATALSLELRDLLDPMTVADIRRLEGAKTQGASVQALERAVAALRARAQALDGQAQAMRQSARTPR